MKAFVLALPVVLMGCGDSIPSTAQHAPSAQYAPSLAVYGATSDDLVVARSSAELRAAIGRVRRAAPPPRYTALPEASGGDGVDTFVSETSFAANDVAVVRAGGHERMRFVGTTTSGDRITLHFTGVCPPCGGGNPGSYEEARRAEEAARAERVEVVRIPKGARVETRESPASCGTCARDVP